MGQSLSFTVGQDPKVPIDSEQFVSISSDISPNRADAALVWGEGLTMQRSHVCFLGVPITAVGTQNILIHGFD